MEVVKVLLLYQKVGEVFKKEKSKISWTYIRKTRLSKNSPICFSPKTTKFCPKKSLVSTTVGWVLEIVPKPH